MNMNIISTPDITGNIGSCTTQKESVIIGREGILTIEKRDIATNSCTGQVTTSDYWEFSSFAFLGSVLIVYIAIIIISNR